MKKPDYDRLYKLALQQEGFFTAFQASNCGYSRQLQVYYVRKGEWIRKVRSVFRFKYFPVLPCHPEEYFVTQLWTENRNGTLEGVFGYRTALFLHEAGDQPPTQLDVIVPKNFRRNTQPPDKCNFYRRKLDARQVETIHGLQVTKLLWTILDLLDVELIERSELLNAIRKALENGRLTLQEIKETEISDEQKARLFDALKEIDPDRFEAGC